MLEANKNLYNFIYIDRVRTKEQIPKYFINLLESLLKEGVIWIDDYLGDHGKLKKNLIMPSYFQKQNMN